MFNAIKAVTNIKSCIIPNSCTVITGTCGNLWWVSSTHRSVANQAWSSCFLVTPFWAQQAPFSWAWCHSSCLLLRNYQFVEHVQCTMHMLMQSLWILHTNLYLVSVCSSPSMLRKLHWCPLQSCTSHSGFNDSQVTNAAIAATCNILQKRIIGHRWVFLLQEKMVARLSILSMPLLLSLQWRIIFGFSSSPAFAVSWCIVESTSLLYPFWAHRIYIRWPVSHLHDLPISKLWTQCWSLSPLLCGIVWWR